MLILLVEDEAPKAEKIKRCIQELWNSAVFHTARSVRSAMECLDDHFYDLVVLDMSLPTFDIGEDEFGGRPQGFGGVEIMRDMENNDIHTPVIVVTAYETFPVGKEEGGVESREITIDELGCLLDKEFDGNFIDLIRYDTYLSDWKKELSLSLLKLGK